MGHLDHREAVHRNAQRLDRRIPRQRLDRRRTVRHADTLRVEAQRTHGSKNRTCRHVRKSNSRQNIIESY